MARYAAGDDVAFARLFVLLAPQIEAFFRRSFVDRTLAEDLTQATFLRLHRHRKSYRPDLPLKPWLYSMAACERQDELRRQYRLPAHVGESEIEAAEPRAWDQARLRDGSSAIVAVEEAIRRLPESQRVVLHLHNHQEMTFEQIAEVLGTTAGAIRVRASRAYERLRVELREYYKPRKP
jgi:RNA polymerase sigma-70 factor (ECF subfamily)